MTLRQAVKLHPHMARSRQSNAPLRQRNGTVNALQGAFENYDARKSKTSLCLLNINATAPVLCGSKLKENPVVTFTYSARSSCYQKDSPSTVPLWMLCIHDVSTSRSFRDVW